MKILVFDDNQTHCAAARAQLKDHDLTVVDTYDKAQELLTPQINHEKVSAVLKSQFGDFDPWSSKDQAKRAEYWVAVDLAKKQATVHPDFDVVLTDLLVLASQQQQGPKGSKFVGQEMPVGAFIGLLAAVRGRAKFVAVFTDSDHHSHPASACFDVFNYEGGSSEPTMFTVEGSKVLLCNNGNWVSQFDTADLSRALEYNEYSKRSDTVRAKNWAALLEYLIK